MKVYRLDENPTQFVAAPHKEEPSSRMLCVTFRVPASVSDFHSRNTFFFKAESIKIPYEEEYILLKTTVVLGTFYIISGLFTKVHHPALRYLTCRRHATWGISAGSCSWTSAWNNAAWYCHWDMWQETMDFTYYFTWFYYQTWVFPLNVPIQHLDIYNSCGQSCAKVVLQSQVGQWQ